MVKVDSYLQIEQLTNMQGNLEIKLESDGDLFDNVIIGPTAHPGLAMSSLIEFLVHKNVGSGAQQSGIPYREWK